MSHAARNYAQVARSAMPPRDLEATALLKAASTLQIAAENATENWAAFDEALLNNRRLWTIFATSVSEEASQLPDEVKLRVSLLADFVFNQTIKAQAEHDAGLATALIRINRELAAGLRSGT